MINREEPTLTRRALNASHRDDTSEAPNMDTVAAGERV
jgi:hypothetical protein